MFVTRNVRIKYMAPAGEGGSDGGGTGTGTGEGGKGGTGGEGEGSGEGEGGEGAPGGEGGAKKPTDEEARLLKENMKKKGQIDELTKKLNDATGVLTQLEALGGLEAIQALVNEKKDAETKGLEAKGDYERLKQRMVEEHTSEVNKIKGQLKDASDAVSKLNAQINELTIGAQFSNSQFIAGELTLTPAKARVIYGDHFDLVEGQVVGYDKPRGAANRTALVDGYGNNVAFDQALAKIVAADPEKDHLLKDKTRPGAGSDTRKTGQQREEAPTDSVSKISAGLKGLKLT